ncbi:XRE family transcriptional regulator [Streptomyces violascens]|uniref:XRE family transcriptional regulator n=1 Tax=Streptomyces violascens TaxID=67381 RepID=UPI003654EAC7
MTYRTPRELRARQDLERTRAWVIAYLQRVVGPELTAEAAQAAVEEAKGWGPQQVRLLACYLDETPNALTASTPVTGPVSLVRLRYLLHSAGHQATVTRAVCADCGRTDPLPLTTGEGGRLCGWCSARNHFRTCERCGRLDQVVTHRDEVAICRRCYRKDPLVVTECARCHRMRPPGHRLDDGRALCFNCTPRRKQKCCGCGRLRRVNAHTSAGPVCGNCYQGPMRRCGICGEDRPISVRAVDGRPDVCIGCYRGPMGECSVCGRVRHGGHVSNRGGSFHCRSCRPRPDHTCALCGRTGPTQTTWPLGPVCDTCYQARRATPRPCSSCHDRRIIIGRSDEGGDLCAACCGHQNPAVRCRSCGQSGDLIDGGGCPRCVLAERVRDLLSGNDGTVAEPLQAMADALTRVANPYPVLGWLRRSPSARALTQLAGQQEPVTHEVLDALPQSATTRHVRALLVISGVLPERNEHLARLERWVNRELPDLPTQQATIVRPFAEWHVVRDARRRSSRGRYTSAAASNDIQEIQAAIRLLNWLDARGREATALNQPDLDLWLTEHPTQHAVTGSFLRWIIARRLAGPLELPKRQRQFAVNFLTEDEYRQQLRRCLTDEALPREVRIIGALVRLYALPLSKIIELTADRFHYNDTGAYLTLDRHPVLLPPRLAQLIEDQIAQPRTTTPRRRALDETNRYLLPGQFPGQPRSAKATSMLMQRHGLPVLNARNTAMIEAVTTLPPIVVADLFGLHPETVTYWAKYAGDRWADYLAARQTSKATSGRV